MKLLKAYTVCFSMNIPYFINERRLWYASREQTKCPHSILSTFHRQRTAKSLYSRPGWYHATYKRRTYSTRIWRMDYDHSMPLLHHTACRCFGGYEMSLSIGSYRKRETLH